MWAQITFISIVAIYFLWFIPSSTRLFLSDIYSLSAKNFITVYGTNGQYSLKQWLEARDQLDHALNVSPDDPNLLFSMGQLNAIRGNMSKKNKLISKAYYEEAALFYEKSLKIRPRDALTWINLTITLDAINADPTRFNYALQQSQELNKNEKFSAEVVSRIAMKHQSVVYEQKMAH
jgi:tetratricopeptide (TPR) repeat protein